MSNCKSCNNSGFIKDLILLKNKPCLDCNSVDVVDYKVNQYIDDAYAREYDRQREQDYIDYLRFHSKDDD